MSAIASVTARLFAVPLDEVLVDAKHGEHSHFHLITATVVLEDGSSGTGYTYNGGRGGHAIAAMITHDLAPFLVGRDANAIEALNDEMNWHMHYVGRGGILSFAISAIDIALWDLRGKARGQSVWRMLGGKSPDCRAYGGGIDLAFPLPKLLDHVQGYLDAGLRAVKIKVGQPSEAQDIERIRAVRARIGPEAGFAIDANYSLSREQAVSLALAVQDQGLLWFEEPIIPDDYAGYAEVAAGAASRWRRERTCTRSTSSTWRWSGAGWTSSSRMHQIAAASPGGAKSPIWPRRTAWRSVRTGCRSFTSRCSPASAATGGWRCIPSRSTDTPTGRW